MLTCPTWELRLDLTLLYACHHFGCSTASLVFTAPMQKEAGLLHFAGVLTRHLLPIYAHLHHLQRLSSQCTPVQQLLCC